MTQVSDDSDRRIDASKRFAYYRPRVPHQIDGGAANLGSFSLDYKPLHLSHLYVMTINYVDATLLRRGDGTTFLALP